MHSLNKITVFGNTRALRVLESFRADVLGYFEALESRQRTDGGTAAVETGDAAALRFELNKSLEQVREIIAVAGYGPKSAMEHFPWGSYMSTPADPLDEIFASSDEDRSPQAVLDLIERTIGIYRRNRARALARTVNPFFWLDQIFDAVSEWPFRLLQKMGIARRREVRSPIGKLIKGMLYLLIIAGAGVGVAYLLGYGGVVRSAMRAVLNVL